MAREVGRLNMIDHLRKNAIVEGIIKDRYGQVGRKAYRQQQGDR